MCLGPTDQWPTAVNQDDCLVSYISRVCGWTIRIYDSEWDVLADAMARLEPDTLQDVVTRGHARDHDAQVTTGAVRDLDRFFKTISW